jgi:hypothetical protein
MERATPGTPEREAAVFFDAHRNLPNLNLLDDVRRLLGGFQRGATTRAVLQRVLEGLIQLFSQVESPGGTAARACLGWPGCPPMRRGPSVVS